MAWTFHITRGVITTPEGSELGQHEYSAYSGAPGYRDNPTAEDLKDKGPLPEGIYYMESVVDTVQHGPFCIILSPDESNREYGRGGFMCHGDSIKHPGCASEGCIVTARFVRDLMWKSTDHRLEVLR